ncbi:putative rRNA maturation factor [Clostridium tetanomorphum]|uniref:Endoribonuclease YbeY n=1 Tax=Clostridium tetanomorphum TaxID=1553 RepID=A0A923E6N7_CLOTT|nr:rRNA maturation RNase YbeY [Clostridium tetanomorphum]KAJ53864.1 metal-binding heat shock protein [Clostridium tetanomorphum DSM 665]MBC2397378.1 rRNA maturation RNase YbeY [Clostridium tetanomorphum]MBP1862598.1 putative rRNA maturation factor [Clostridium tetanomorphum]NRS85561.1 putative rRNA maturation factor [Clostridium tetanomorphum]NRZ96428.1 putative rRNA maturation factor [Clostridium tetanomorphum]
MIYIDNRQNKLEVNNDLKSTIEQIVHYALKDEKVEIEYEVSIIFVDNETIKQINRDSREIDKVTDVLSFPMLDYPKGKVYKDVYYNYEFKSEDLDGNNLVLGDIVLSLEKAKEQSEDFGHSFLREACYLTIHSVLHLLGYDHMEEEEKLLMRKREEDILEKFNIGRKSF